MLRLTHLTTKEVVDLMMGLEMASLSSISTIRILYLRKGSKNPEPIFLKGPFKLSIEGNDISSMEWVLLAREGNLGEQRYSINRMCYATLEDDLKNDHVLFEAKYNRSGTFIVPGK